MKTYIIKKRILREKDKGKGPFVKIFDGKQPPFDFIDTEDNLKSKILGRYGPGRYQLIIYDTKAAEKSIVQFVGDVKYEDFEWKTWTRKERANFVKERHYGYREKVIVWAIIWFVFVISLSILYMAVRVDYNPALAIAMIIILFFEIFVGVFFYDLFMHQGPI